jgi:hypothetical protein
MARHTAAMEPRKKPQQHRIVFEFPRIGLMPIPGPTGVVSGSPTTMVPVLRPSK